MVRPWNAPSSARTRGRAVPPWRRAIFSAASLASVPELAKKTREPAGAPPGVTSARSFSARVTWAGVAKKFDTCPSVPSCSVTAAT